MNKLQELISKCKCSVTVTVNDHKDCYLSAIDSLLGDFDMPNNKWQSDNNLDLTDELLNEMDIEGGVLSGMIEKDSIVRVQFYPDTPNGFHMVYHYDLDKALDVALGIIKESK